jgi:hypothetical protein
MGKNIAVTLTTINLPLVVEKLVSQKISSGDRYEIIIIGDLKTPSGTGAYLENLQIANPEILINYMDIDQQNKKFSKYTELWDHIPFNSFSRRNYADLYCLDEKFDYVIRIDDDNFPINDDFILDHIKALELDEVAVVSNSLGWFNICTLLLEEKGKEFYPRGFPYPYRNKHSENQNTTSKAKIGINAGLWLGDPDVDAITRLSISPKVTDINKKTLNSYVALEKGTWAPINTQNTSYQGEILQISFVSPYVGRYDDIFCGYIARSILDQLNIKTSYGLPLVFQDRNMHDLWNDEKLERFGNTSGVEIIDFVKEYKYSNKELLACYEEVVSALDKNFSPKYDEVKKMCLGMYSWMSAVEKVI